MDGDPDRDRELEAESGLLGEMLFTGVPQFADLSDARTDPANLGMTVDQVSKVPGDRQATVAFPVREWPRGLVARVNPEPSSPIVAALMLDSSTDLETTGWTDANAAAGDTDFVDHLLTWVEILAKILS